jgi:hypothetical protein
MNKKIPFFFLLKISLFATDEMKQKNNLSRFSHFDNGRSKYQKTDFLFREEFDSFWKFIFHKQKISFLK